MNRKNFISSVGLSVAAVCTGCLAACSKSADTGGAGAPAGVNFTTDLAGEIPAIGDSKTSNGVILVRIAAGNSASSFTAVQVACTHQGTSINFNKGQGQFVCPNHGSIFSTNGAVLQGPAAIALKKYTVAVTGNTLTVTG